MNKILYPPLIMLGLLLPILVYALYEHTTDSFVVLGICGSFAIFVLWKSMDNFWIYRRLPAISPLYYKTVNVNVNNSDQTGTIYDEESGISFQYQAKEKFLTMTRDMYTDPRRYPKEYEERKYQFKTRIEQAKIPISGWISEANSDICFGTSVRLQKKYATPENIKKIRAVIVDLSKDDYKEELFTKHDIDDVTLYMDTFHYQLIRAMLVKEEKVIERYSPILKMGISTTASDKLAKIFEEMHKTHFPDKIDVTNIIEENEFEKLWDRA